MFVEIKFLFWTANINKDNRYYDVKDKIFNFLNNFLHETLFAHPSIFKGQVAQEEESITISKNNRNHSSNYTMSHPRRLESCIVVPDRLNYKLEFRDP